METIGQALVKQGSVVFSLLRQTKVENNTHVPALWTRSGNHKIAAPGIDCVQPEDMSTHAAMQLF
jgi:hypothetical protein